MRQIKIISLLTIFISMVGVKTHAHNIEVKNADGVTIYYKRIEKTRNVEVTYKGVDPYHYKNEYTGKVDIPESINDNGETYRVTGIGDHAFIDCSNLTSIIMPNSITSIGESAFYGCVGLTNIDIPNTVTYIGGNAFYETGWYKTQSDGILYLDIWLIGYKGRKPSGDVIIKAGTIRLANSAFSGCTDITNITIPNSVVYIGDYVFEDCSSLQSIIIPNSVISIGIYVFSGCSSLCSLTIGSSVLTIGAWALPRNNCKIIWLPNTPPTGVEYSLQNLYDEIHIVANDSYSNLAPNLIIFIYPFISSIFEVDGVKYVPISPSERTCDVIDCAYNESAEHINIGKTVSYKGINMIVKNINRSACYQNPYIKSVDLSFDGNLGDYAFKDCPALKFATLGDEITSIGQYAFNGCKQLQEIIIPNAVTSLGGYAFKDCNSMTSVKMGTGITYINDYTFSSCTSLTDMQIGNNVKTINKYAFQNCSSLPAIQIPQSVTNIQNYVFSGCKNLKMVIIDNKETELELGSNGSSPLFADCPLDSVYIGRNISYSTSSKYGYSPFYRNTTLSSVTITDKETEISQNEFYGCTNLKNVRIGDGVTTIGDWAFSGCSSLDYFAFGSSVKTIGKEAFSDCTALTKLISRAAIPPTCGSQALDDINKWNCTLSVPIGAKSAYQQANQWKDFFFINDDVTSISKLTNNIASPNYINDLNGRKLKEPSKGINIIRMNDGTTKKIIMK